MTDHNKTPDASPNAEQRDSKPSVSAARRRFIKNSAVGVPVVLTLRSGAAAAMASTYACREQAQQIAEELQERNDFPTVRNRAGYDQFLTAEGTGRYLYEIEKENQISEIEDLDASDKDKDKDEDSDGNYKWKLKLDSGQRIEISIFNPDPEASEWWTTEVDPPQVVMEKRKKIRVKDVDGITTIKGKHMKIEAWGKHYIVHEQEPCYGLVMTDVDGAVEYIDSYPRVGKIVDSGELMSQHITYSCWASINHT